MDPWVGMIPWRRAWKPTPVFLPGESHGQRSLVSYSLEVAKSWTQLKQLSMHKGRKGKIAKVGSIKNKRFYEHSEEPNCKLGNNKILAMC